MSFRLPTSAMLVGFYSTLYRGKHMYVSFKELPGCVQKALSAHFGIKGKDISVNSADSWSPRVGGGAGQQGVCCVVNLETGETKAEYGSWGGANMFNPTNLVDLSDQTASTAPNIVVINGHRGYRPWASITVHPSTVPLLLPSPNGEVTDKEKRILTAYRSLKSGPYRKEELQRIGATQADIESLAQRGYLKIARNGATSVTTKGKNAA